MERVGCGHEEFERRVRCEASVPNAKWVLSAITIVKGDTIGVEK